MNLDLFGMHKGYEVVCPAGEWTTLVKVSMRNYADVYVFSTVDGLPVDGVVKLTSGYIFPTPEELQLTSPMTFQKSSFDTSYKIAVKPDRLCVLRTPDRDGLVKTMSYLLSFHVYMVCFGFLLLIKTLIF